MSPDLNEGQAAAFRNENLGFVFQDHALLPQCTVLENVLVPTLVAPVGPYEVASTQAARARRTHRTGWITFLPNYPAARSSDAAIARALIREPQLAARAMSRPEISTELQQARLPTCCWSCTRRRIRFWS